MVFGLEKANFVRLYGDPHWAASAGIHKPLQILLSAFPKYVLKGPAQQAVTNESASFSIF